LKRQVNTNMAEPLTKEDLEALMLENLEKISAMVDEKLAPYAGLLEPTKPSLKAMQMYHDATFNVTSFPVLPRGTEVIVDLRSASNACGMVAKYRSLGNKYVEEWAKIVLP